MRTHFRTLLLATLAVSAFGAVAAASASASEFVFSKTGTLKGAQVSAYNFTTPLGIVGHCSKDKVSGSTTVLKSATQKVSVQYEGCSLSGIGLIATAAEYELNTNGTYKLLKAFTMTGGMCKLTFPVQNLSGDTYKNASGKVEVLTESQFVSSGSGICAYEEGKGAIEGASLIELVGGTMEVK